MKSEISQPQAEEVEVHKFTQDLNMHTPQGEFVRGPISLGDEVIYPAEAKWDRVDGPLLWRDTVNELDAYIEEFTRERDSLINRLAEEGFALIPAMALVMGVADVDMSDWRNWKRGDIVEVIIPNDGKLPIGNRYTVCEIEAPEYCGGMMVKVFDDEGDSHWPEDDKYEGRMVFKFIRRP